MAYYMNKTIDADFNTAIDKVTEELKQAGFGVLTEIDVKNTFKKKLDVDFKNYKILGACNPNFAYQALQKEDKVGALLPCNVIVEDAGEGKTEVSAVDPAASMQAVDNDELLDIAGQVRDQLKNVIERLS